MSTLIALAILTLGQFMIGLLLWLEGQRTKRVDQRLFGTVAFLVIGWTLSVGVLTGIDNSDAGNHELFYVVVNCLAFSLSCAIVLVVYLFSLVYPIKRHIGWWQKLLIGLGGFTVLFSSFPPIAGHFKVQGQTLEYTYGPLVSLVAFYVVLTVISIYIEETSLLRHTREIRLRRQARTLLLGTALTVVHAVVFVVLVPIIFGQKTIFYTFGYVAPYYLLLFAGYGLLRQGLFDIRAIVARSLAYLLSFTITSLLYIAPTVLLSTYLLHAPLKPQTLAALVVVTLIVALLFGPLRSYFNKVTNKFFYRDYYDPQDVLDQLSSVLVGTVEVDQILTRTQEILATSLRPIKVSFLFASEARSDEDKRFLHEMNTLDAPLIGIEDLDHGHYTLLRNELRRQDIALAARLRTAHEDLGFMLLGVRRSGTGYSKVDQRLIGAVADELAVGLQNALRFKEIERFNTTLQQKIMEATRNLRNANDKLRKLDETKDDFISMASHQLRTPLTSVKGYVSMVLDGDVGKITSLQRKLLTQSFISSQRMVYLISDLLNVSRLKTGKFIIEPAPTDLSAVIQEEIGQLQETAKGRNLELIYHKPEHFPTLMFDETKIRQVIMNFIDNAVYYTPSGGHITVNLVDKPQSVEFTVVDDGIGVPRHEQHHLFSKFYRANNAKRARPDGTGLGLFMAKKVIIAQGGATVFKSQEGKGSTFGFSFSKQRLLPSKQKPATTVAPTAPEKSVIPPQGH